jgi:hypothetical protein
VAETFSLDVDTLPLLRVGTPACMLGAEGKLKIFDPSSVGAVVDFLFGRFPVLGA